MAPAALPSLCSLPPRRGRALGSVPAPGRGRPRGGRGGDRPGRGPERRRQDEPSAGLRRPGAPGLGHAVGPGARSGPQPGRRCAAGWACSPTPRTSTTTSPSARTCASRCAAAGGEPSPDRPRLRAAGPRRAPGQDPAGKLSAGQRRRVALAVLTARWPELWLLDEPHAGLDAAARASSTRPVVEAAASWRHGPDRQPRVGAGRGAGGRVPSPDRRTGDGRAAWPAAAGRHRRPPAPSVAPEPRRPGAAREDGGWPMWRDAALVAGKDLRIEGRSRVALSQVAPFGIVALVLFAFALGPDRQAMAKGAPGPLLGGGPVLHGAGHPAQRVGGVLRRRP